MERIDIEKHILDSLSQVLILSLDTSYRYLYFNDVHIRAMNTAYGTSPAIGTNIFTLITNTADKEKSKINYDRALQGETHSTLEAYGEIQQSFFKTTYQPIKDDNGTIIGVTAMANDVSEQYQAENALRESEERFRSIFENNSSGICLDEVIYDDEGNAVDYRIIDVNESFEGIIGIKRSEIAGRLASEVYGPGPVPFLEIFSAVAASRTPQVFETFFEPTQKQVRVSVSCPKEGMFSNVLSDVTEMRRLSEQREQALVVERERAEELETLYSAARLILEGNDVEHVIGPIFSLLKETTGSTGGFIALVEPDGSSVRPLVMEHAAMNPDHYPESMPFEQLWELISDRSESPVISDEEEPWRNLLHAHYEPLGSLLITPMKSQQKTIGIVCLTNTRNDIIQRAIRLAEGMGNVIAIALHATRQRRALEESERRYDAFLNTHKDYMFVKDENLRYTFVNEAMAQFFHMSRQDLIGMDDIHLLGPEAGRGCEVSDRKALATNTTIVSEEQIGSDIFETTKFPISLMNGERLLGGIIRDVTKEKRSLEERKKNEARLNSLVNILQHPVMTTQQFLDYALEEAISLTASEFGYIYYYQEDTKQFILNTWSRDVMDQCRVMSPQTCYELDKTGLWGEAVRQRRAIIVNDFMAENPLKKGFPDGHVRLTRYMTTPIFSSDKVVAVVGMANKKEEYDQTDVLQLQLLMESVWRETEHRSTQEELRRIEWMLTPQAEFTGEKLRFSEDTQGYGDLTELNNDGMLVHFVGRETLQNLAADYLDLLGTSSAIYEVNGDYAMGIFESGWCQLMDRASRKLCGNVSNTEALASGKWLCHESCWTDCSKRAIETGEPVDILCNGGIHLYAVPIRAGEQIIGAINFGYGDPPTDQARLVELSKQYQIPFETLSQEASAYDSRPPYIIEMARKRLSETARLIGLLVLGKQSEERQIHLNDQLRQSQKMEAIGQLAGGIAHDFNNILQAIMGYAQLLRPLTDDHIELGEGLDEIYRCGERASSLTRQLLAFSRRQIMRPENLDLNVVVGNLQSMLKRVIGEHITLKWFPGSHLGMIHADISMMEQVIMNLCVNARDAMRDGGVLTLETQNVLIDDYYSSNNIWATPGRYVLLSVTDTGVGMSEEVKEHIFEPFFTTKPEGQGTGLGLSTVYGIVKQHDGMITAYSELGKGTTIKVYYPMTERRAVDVGNMIRPQVQGGNETILLAEDDPGVRALVVKILERAGYGVVVAKNGYEAVEVFQNHRERISLLLLDVVMPGMGGHEAYERIERIESGLPVIFTSGYSENAVHTDFVLHEGLKLLQKPYSPDALLVLVRQVLDRES